MAATETQTPLETRAHANTAWWLLLVLPVGLAASVDARWTVFACAAVTSGILAARHPVLLLAGVLSVAAADLVLTVDVAGFTFRAAQVAGVALTAAAVSSGGLIHYVKWVVSRPGLLAWVVFLALQTLSVVMGVPNPGKGVGYLAWGVFDVLVLAPSVAWHARRHLPRTVAGWTVGATCIAIFGLGQLVMGVAGADPLLVTQWFGGRPRINAFSYEPSYFAFQAIIPVALLCGLSVAGVLRKWAPAATACALVLAAALTFSSSRSAWLGLGLLSLAFVIGMAWRWRLTMFPSTSSLRAWATAGAVLSVLAVFTPPSMLVDNRVLALRALNLNDEGSVQPRTEGLRMAWRLFQLAPVVGFGPGQFGGALLDHPEVWARDIPEGKRSADDLVTFNVYFELLAQSGVLGFASSAAALVWTAWSLWRLRRTGLRGRFAEALLWPLLLTFGVMFQFNQTLWRTEVWCLLGLCWSLWPQRRKG